MLLWGSVVATYAQPAEPYQLTVFGTQDGLPHNSIQALCQDRNGYLWIGTEAGLSRYNGYRFEHFLQADGRKIGHVRTIFETPDGVLWIGTETGIFTAFHGKVYAMLPAFESKFRQVRCFLWDENRQRLWFACASGPYYFTRQQMTWWKTRLDYENAQKLNGSSSYRKDDSRSFSWAPIIPQEHRAWASLMSADLRAFSLALDDKNRLWVGNSNSLNRCDDSTCTSVWKSEGTNEITCLLPTGKDSLYFGGNASTLMGCFNEKVQSFADSMYYVTDLFRHGRDYLFFSAGEMYRILPERVEKIWDHPIRVGISDVIVDRENNVWVASWEGLVKISPRHFKQMPVEQYPDLDEIYGIGLDAAGRPLFGANHGKAFQLSPVGSLRPLHPRICPNANINDFYTDTQGRCWMATEYEGLAVLEAGQIQRLDKKDGLHDEGLFALLPLKDGNFWAIGDGGASSIHLPKDRVQKEKPIITAYRFTEPQEGLNTLTCGVEDPLGGVWFGGNLGLYKLVRNGLEEVQLLPNQSLVISGMSLDPLGRLWISTLGNGLICCVWKEAGWQIVQSFTEENGLYSNNTLNVLADSGGRIWVGYGFGIGLLEAFTGNGRQIRYFNHRDGLFQKGCRRMKILEAPDGNFWVVSPIGVCRFRPETFSRNETAPLVRISSLELFDGAVDYMSYCDSINERTGLPEGLALPYALNHLRFVFDGLSLTNPDNNRFKFRLSGAETRWRTPEGGDLQATYPKLPPGDYTFMVQAANSDGVWATMPATFHFRILAPFWQKTWFWVLLGLLFVGTTLLIAGRRIRTIRQREAEKTRIQTQIAELKIQALRSQINPHFIFNCLAGIQECVLQEQFMEANEYLTRFARLLRMILESTDKAYIPLRQELEMLRLYLELENTRLSQQIDYQIDTKDLEEDALLMIPAFIIQPFVENAIWHGLMHKAGQKELRITIAIRDAFAGINKNEKKISAEEKTLTVDIFDNGIGRVKSAEIRQNKIVDRKSKGIRIIEDRLWLIHENASVTYKDLYDGNGIPAGTSVRIEIPVASETGEVGF